MACQRFGTFSFSHNGRAYSPRGSWTIRPTNRTVDANTNMDGSMYLTEAPVPAEAEGTLSGLTQEFIDAMGSCDGTAILSFDNGDSYVFVDAAITGRPELAMESGETSGIMIKSRECYLQTN